MNVGSQQFTIRNIEFRGTAIAIKHIWNWGFVWQNIRIYDCLVGMDITSTGGRNKQGTGSIALLGEPHSSE